MNSPEYIQTSLAAAMSLGFEPGRFKDPVRLTGLNLLLTYDKGCLGKCAYCGIAGSRQDTDNKQNFRDTSNNPHTNDTANNQDPSYALNKQAVKEPLKNQHIQRKDNNTPGGPVAEITDTGLLAADNSGSKRISSKKTFIRVKWPVYRLDDVLYALQAHESSFERVCLSLITHPDAVRDTITITKKIKQFSDLPISLLITPSLITSPEILKQFKEAGAEMAGIAIDAATNDLFIKYRGAGVGGPHKWEKYWEVLKWAVDVFGCFKAGIHLIVGLGETEEEAVKTIYRAQVMGAKTHLFSFYPEPASILEDLDRPGIFSYRKIQIARYLINEKGLDISKIRFGGSIISFDYDIKEVLKEGYAFMTSGCPCSSDSRISACNRPFANERPSETFRNYPYVPNNEEKKTIESQISGLLI